MNTKLKNNQGITLIALIITIIILVILAAVSIRAVTNMGIVGHAINGTQDYARATVQEQAELREAAIKTTIAEYRLKNILDNVDLKSFLESKGYEVIANGDGTLSFDMDGYTITVDEENLSYTSEKNNNMARIAFLKDGSKTSVVAPNDTVTVSLKFGDNVDVANTKYLYTSSATVENTAITGSLPNSNQEQTITTGLDTSTIGTKYFYLLVAYKDGTESTRKVETLQIGTPVTSIKLYKDGQEASEAVAAITGETLKGTKTLTLHAVVEPDNATDKTVTWESSDTSVATVANGVVTAQDVEEAGTVTITATANGGANVTATCEIAVTPKPTSTVAFTVTEGEGANEVTTEYTWEDVHNIANLISADSTVTRTSSSATVTYEGNSITLNTGDVFDLVGVIGTGNNTSNYTYKVRIIGFNTDTLSSTGNSDRAYTNGGSKAGITFQFTNFFRWDGTKEYTQMNSSNTNEDGWGASLMQTNLNLATTLARLTNSAYIKTVDKKYIETYNQTTAPTTVSADKLWLLACSEIWPEEAGTADPRYGYAKWAESDGQYKWYADNVTSAASSVTDAEKAKLVKKTTNYTANPPAYGENSAYNWWLRSPSYSNTTYFCFVSSDGGRNNTTANNYYYVAPGFSI